ncbi:S49 family peptidase [Roseibium sediminis]|uniref:S49 family peptidase n=1 Tax=Roseibium sediminis TaxID=1775174 RepID=UPI00123D3D5A|nr:S49 family peptidase [Roseibium sediminis]
MSNPFLTSFDKQAVLVAPGQEKIVESNLHQAHRQYEALLVAEVNAAGPAQDDFWFTEDDWRSVYRPYIVRDGILQIQVKGVLLHDFPYQFGSWATGYDYIWRAFKRGQEDENVKGVALIANTPGGTVAGCFDLVDKMYGYANRKPLKAFANEHAFSAGYAVASAADKISVSRTGAVGSIGVVTAHVDVSKMLDEIGYKVTFIHFGKHKVDGNSYGPLSAEVKADIQARIDELGEIFVSTVARNRGISKEAVRSTEAQVFGATQAVSNGLADEIGTLDDAVAAFAAELSLDEEDEQMSGQNKNPAVDQAAENAEAIESARTEAHKAGFAEGASAERERISGIIGCDEAKSRPRAAMSAALKTDMSLDAAKAFLSDLEEEGGARASGQTPFEQAMDRDQNPDLGTPGEGDTPKGQRAERAFALLGKSKKAAG